MRTQTRAQPGENSQTPRQERMPLVFLPHGGGPWPFIDEAIFGAPGMWDDPEGDELAVVLPQIGRAHV